MSRFGPDPQAFFDAVYQGAVPWAIGALVTGGRLYLHEFAVEFPVPNVPRAVTEGEVRGRFAESAGWRVLHVAPADFSNTVAAPTPAIVACIERAGSG